MKKIFLRDLLRLMRPQQWYKNLIIFSTLFFAKEITNFNLFSAVFLGFISLSIISSSSYIINDIIDKKRDSAHPEKKNRPIAAGRISSSEGAILALLLLIPAIILSYFISSSFFYIALTFFVINMSYSLFFKKEIIIDVMVISILFMIRAISGAIIIDITISPWLVICIFFLTFFLVSIKRRSDIILMGNKSMEHKEVLKDYTLDFLQKIIILSSSVLVLGYCLYSFLKQNDLWIITVPFVIYSILRYEYITTINTKIGRHPELIISDKRMVAAILLWVIISITLLYLT